jgi:aldehyde:ferredoxin oxidoreductase
MMTFGFHDRILRVNLSTREIREEHPGQSFYRQFLGGTGIVAYYLYKELEPGTDPLGPNNKLIFAGGPLTGSPLIGGGRNSVGAKSPLTGAIGHAEAGGFFGAEMRRAGYDALIIEGRAEHPVYLAIVDDQVEIRDARHLWGKLTADVQAAIQEEMGDKLVRVAQIGVAGENLVRYANITNDLTHFYGRSGIGAVMGSKNLRAVAIRGRRLPKMADQEQIMELNRWMNENWKNLAASMHDLGTTGIVLGLNASGGLPTRNFREGTFEGAESISGQRMRDTILVGREGCYACPIRCKRVVKSEERYEIDPTYGGPEYETLGSLGSTCGVSDLLAVCKGNELCNALGLDTISTGVTIAFAMECYETGLLTREDTDGLELRFGNGQALVELIQKIARREGFGALLAEGCKRAAEQIGNGAENLAMEVKGQEIPMHEPRLKQGLGVGYQVSPTGADHCHNMHDTAFTREGPGLDRARAIGVSKALPADRLDAEKASMLKAVSHWRHLANCAEVCQFVPWSYRQIETALNAATGWDTSLLEYLRIAERAVTLMRLFNVREGLDDADDYLPDRFYQPLLGEGPLKGVAVDREAAYETRQAYYRLMGWDETGVPTETRLADLNLLWTRQHSA